MDDSGFNPAKGKRFISSSKRQTRFWGPPSLLFDGYRWREANHAPPFSAVAQGAKTRRKLDESRNLNCSVRVLHVFPLQDKCPVFHNVLVVKCSGRPVLASDC